MQILLALAVVAVLAVAQTGPAEPVAGVAMRLVAASGGMACVALFAAVSSGVTARGLRRDPGGASRLVARYRRLRRAHVLVWLIVAGSIAWGLDWARIVRFNGRLDGVFLLDETLILLPLILPLVLSWCAFYEVDRYLFGPARGDGAAVMATRREYLGLHVRHYLGLLLAPTLGLLALGDLAGGAAPGWLQGRGAALAAMALPWVLLALFPWILRYVWRTRPLAPGPLRTRLETAAARAGYPVREILVWQTHSLVVNAAVAGFVPPLRYVFLSDGLLDRLTDREVEAVFGHELGHVRHHHLPLRMAAMFVPLSLWLGLAGALPNFATQGDILLGSPSLAMAAPWGLGALAAMGLYVLTFFGFVSRRLETQADLFACRFLGSDNGVGTFVAALEKLAEAQGRRDTRGWQHASVARRVEFLQTAARRPDVELRYDRRVRLLGCAVLGLATLPLIGLLW
ncbi:MAG: M48 family metalloprotease [Pirellulales bacterium]|nr:M48 family metalloprotease [Pirellulales bacterium]